MSELVLRNRQRLRRVNTPLLRRIVRALLQDFCGVENYELCFHLVAAPEMARLNEAFLRHGGSADVITFDHSNHDSPFMIHPSRLHGEIFVCVDEAVSQARRFRTTWQSELVRYIIHGILHLRGYDDKKSTARRKMKREEGRLLRRIADDFDFNKLSPGPKLVA